MRLLTLYILSSALVLTPSSYSFHENTRQNARRSPAGKAVKKNGRCSSLFIKSDSSIRRGLVPETEPANTIIIGDQRDGFDETYLDLYRQIDPNARVIFVRTDGKHRSELVRTLRRRGNVTFVDTDFLGSTWVRDWIPQKVIQKDGRIEYVNLRYTAKSFGQGAAARFAKALNLPHYESWIQGEMGNIMVDGKNRLFTTDLILDVNRDIAGFKREEIIGELKYAFEVDEVHFLPQHPRDPIGHIDMVAKYLGNIQGRETVVVSTSKEPMAKETLDKVARKFMRLGFKVIRIEEYKERIGAGVAGFVNSILFNQKIYLPIYSKGLENPPKELVELEQKAKETYESLGFEVLEVNSTRPIRIGKGAIHCLTSGAHF